KKQICPLASFQWVPRGDERWLAHRRGHYKANMDVMMAIDAVELSAQMRPDVIILVTGDADFAYLALELRRRGIRVEVASVAQNLGSALKSAANQVIDLAPLFATFEVMQDKGGCA